MQIIDVTLRESVYYESGMTYEDRLQYLRNLCKYVSNDFIQYVEICFIDNDVDADLNYDEKFIKDAYEICKGKYKLVAMLHPGKADWTGWSDDVIKMLDMARIMIPLNKMAGAKEYIKYFHERGVKVACNLLYAGSALVDEIISMEKEAVEMGADYFYCADSSGSFTPEFTNELSGRLVKNKEELEVGLHLHNHMGMSLANALIAKSHGIEMADVSILGAGKGGGNMKMEEALLMLYGKEKIDYPLMSGLYNMINEFCRMVSKDPAGDQKSFIDFLTGVFKLNLKDLANIEKYAGNDIEKYLQYIAERNKV